MPDGRGFLGGWGPLPGPWFEPGFREKGYDNLDERVAIARDLIDRFYTMLAAVVAMPAFAHVQLVDLRDTLSTDLGNDRYKAWWGNELHPTQQGFSKVAGSSTRTCRRAGPRSREPPAAGAPPLDVMSTRHDCGSQLIIHGFEPVDEHPEAGRPERLSIGIRISPFSASALKSRSASAGVFTCRDTENPAGF